MTDQPLQLLQMLDPARRDERCGFVLQDGSVVEVGNVHEEPELGFRMDPADVLAHVEHAIATWHTHPASGPNLSQEDYAGFSAWPTLQHHIIGANREGPALKTYAVVDGAVMQL